MKQRNRDLHGAVPDSARMVLLIMDMFSDFRFKNGEAAARRAWPVAERIAALKARCARRKIPAIYVNDNLGRWRSDFGDLVRSCVDTRRGAPIARLLRPRTADYCILKPKHSGFFATPLDTLLQYLGTKQLVITGIASQQCILFTANDAYVRDYALAVPTDCIVSLSKSEAHFAKYYFRKVLKADIRKSSALILNRRE